MSKYHRKRFELLKNKLSEWAAGELGWEVDWSEGNCVNMKSEQIIVCYDVKLAVDLINVNIYAQSRTVISLFDFQLVLSYNFRLLAVLSLFNFNCSARTHTSVNSVIELRFIGLENELKRIMKP